MKPRYRNIFLLFGMSAIALMVYSFGVDFQDMSRRFMAGGSYLPAVLGIWVIVYAFNAKTFQIIVNNSDKKSKEFNFLQSYKYTISGFAFSYTTPFGVGGLPYRIMELSSIVGKTRALSCTLLYSMMHILSHFCQWLTAVILFILLRPQMMTPLMWMVFGIFVVVCTIVFYFFNYGYKNGMIVKLYSILLHIPFIKRYARKYYDKNLEAMERLDTNIALLHSRPAAFYSTLLLEYTGRMINVLEYFFILHALGVAVSYADALFVLAFVSLIGNLFFFFPMQLGAREGGLAAIVQILGFTTPSIGLYTGFYTRIREIFWVTIGVLLVKVGNKNVETIIQTK